MTHRDFARLALGAAALLMAGGPAGAQPTTTFTYQGRLTQLNAPLSGTCSFTFTLWDAAQGGAEVASPISQTLPVTGGLFATALDFGGVAFAGAANRYLQVAVSCGSSQAVLPRQQVTAAPFAITSGNTHALHGLPVSDNPSPPVSSVLTWTGGIWSAEPPTGDVSEVTVAPLSGLLGGGTSGAVQLDVDRSVLQRRIVPCGPGGTLQSVDEWGVSTCLATGDITQVTPAPGSGLTGGGVFGDLTLGVDPAVLQRRVGPCPAGSSLRSVDQNGVPTCVTAGDITQVATVGGSGLLGGGTTGDVTLSVDHSILQQRVGSCPAGSNIRAVDINGVPSCQPDAAPSILGWEVVETSCTFPGALGQTGVCTQAADCPAGKRVIGGGADSECNASWINGSFPQPNPQGTWRWQATAVKPSTFECIGNNILTVWAICARLD